MASRSPVKTSETAPTPAGSTAGPGLTGGAGVGGGGTRRSCSGKNVGQLISRRIRARAPSIEVRWPGGGGPGGGGGAAGAAGAFSDASPLPPSPSPLPPSPSPSDNGPVGDVLLASFDDSSEEPSDRAASESRRRAAAAWKGHPDGMADATTSSSSRAAAASTGQRVPFVPSRPSPSAGNPSDAKALACWAIASDAGRGSQRPQKGPRSSPWRSRSAFSARAAFSARWSTGHRVPTRSRCGQWSSAASSDPLLGFSGDPISSRLGAEPSTPPSVESSSSPSSPAATGVFLRVLAAGASVPLVAILELADPGGCPSTDRGNGDWYWLGDDGDASTETAPVLGHRAGVMLTSSAWFLPAKPGVLGAIGRWGMGPRRL
mmetsp:Transcript_5014/g.18818  ORF Transcript_5014/g.18818 Transcript_5014/m.18818 type:complete len:375 (+) Transcript_5014:1674-2798(+)